jgi:hypothetical protein
VPAVQYPPLLGTQVSNFFEVSLTLDYEVTDYNYACVCFGFFPLIKLTVISGDTCHDFPACKSLQTTMTTYVTRKLLLTLFFFSMSTYILVKLVLRSWFVNVKDMMR